MISERQLDANRRNAAKSHGPITPEGRAAVRLNALKHGFTAAEIILPTVEEKIDFEQFRFAFEEEYKPVGPTEEVLVEDIVTARWRLNRIRKMEPGFFSLRLEVMNDRIQDDFSALDPQAHLAWSFVTTPKTPTPSARCPATKAVSNAPSTNRSKSYSAFKHSVPQCPIPGLGLFRRVRCRPIPNPRRARHPHPNPLRHPEPKRQRGGLTAQSRRNTKMTFAFHQPDLLN